MKDGKSTFKLLSFNQKLQTNDQPSKARLAPICAPFKSAAQASPATRRASADKETLGELFKLIAREVDAIFFISPDKKFEYGSSKAKHWLKSDTHPDPIGKDIRSLTVKTANRHFPHTREGRATLRSFLLQQQAVWELRRYGIYIDKTSHLIKKRGKIYQVSMTFHDYKDDAGILLGTLIWVERNRLVGAQRRGHHKLVFPTADEIWAIATKEIA